MRRLENQLKKEGYCFIIGIDEAGRGPLAGPVVAAAVYIHSPDFDCPIRDSKKLSPKQREEAFHEICDKSHFGIGIISEEIIDQVNILQATFIAMQNAVRQLAAKMEREQPDGFHEKVCLLIDGNQFKSELTYKYQTIVEGDAHVFSIACASIVAKVTRDRILTTYDQVFPQYGFRQHKGYGTAQHREAIRIHGLSSIHRRSFTSD